MFEFQVESTDGAARSGALQTPHGRVMTPAFMPVGTNGSVRALSPFDLRAIGTEMILANTYHLHVRPGEDVVSELGGIQKFSSWSGPVITDSGGFQVFSLEGFRSVDEDGVEFRSPVDGSIRKLTPEKAMEIQWKLGADVAMAFDHVIPGDSDREPATDASERTIRWLERCASRHRDLSKEYPDRQTLWPIVQGGAFDDLRLASARAIGNAGDWTGWAIGGLAVGEPKPVMYRVLDTLNPELPPDKPRYLMGVGFPEDLIESIGRGVDLFDCVAPTRNGRNGQVYTADGKLNIRNAGNRTSQDPIEQDCDCETCTSYSRGYLRHLLTAGELLALRLLSLHNVRFLIRLAGEARRQIEVGGFQQWSRNWLDRYLEGNK